MLVIWGGFEYALGDWRAYGVCNGLNASVRWGGDAAGPLNLRLLGSSLVGRRRSGNTSAPMGDDGAGEVLAIAYVTCSRLRTYAGPSSCNFANS